MPNRWSTWFRKVFSSSYAHQRRSSLARRNRLNLAEFLESRRLLSTTTTDYYAGIVTSTLPIPGSGIPATETFTQSPTSVAISAPTAAPQQIGEATASAAHLTIVATFDSSITSSRDATTIQTIEQTINGVISEYEAAFSDPITVNITFKDLGPQTTIGLAQSNTMYFQISYSNFLSMLTDIASTSNDINKTTALAHLPKTSTDPVLGETIMNIKYANLAALDGRVSGFPSTVSIDISQCNLDRTTINPNKYKYDLAAVAAHEIDEVLGLGSNIGHQFTKKDNNGLILPEDLYRYDQSGNRSPSTDTSAKAYFSLDGTTRLAQFNQNSGGDYGDWATGSVPHVQDAFCTPGVIIYPNVEFVALDVLGYHFNPLAPNVTTNPTSQSSDSGQTVSFTAAANGIPMPTVQWQFSIDGGKSFADVPGATSTTYSFAATAAQNGYEYQAVFTNPGGQATTTPATLTVRSAATITVTTLSDTETQGQTTLRDAVEQADMEPGNNNTITFASSLSGTITLAQGPIFITNSMTITGLGASHLTIDGGWDGVANDNVGFQVFIISNSTANVTISGLTIAHADPSVMQGGGGAITNSGNLTLANDTISGSSGVGIATVGECTSSNVTIFGNSGVGVYNGVTWTSSDDTISGNSGGGIYNGGTWTSMNDTIARNSVGPAGGGVENMGTWNSTNDTISGNSAFYGGGVRNDAKWTSTNDTIEGNKGGVGGGVGNYSIWTSSGDTISDNNASGSGGGVSNDTSGRWNSSGDTISGNSTNGDGGGAANNGWCLSTNDTIAGNSATNDGGGVLAGLSWTSINDTIAGNSATLGGGIANLGFGDGLYSLNTIVCGNTGGNLYGNPVVNTTLSNQISGDVAQILSTDANGEPLLANNGGSTMTIALVTGSPVIGNAVPVAKLAHNLAAGATTMNVADGTFFAAGQVLLVDNEIVTVSGVSGTSITIRRAASGGTSHNSDTSITLAYDQTGALRTANDIGAVEKVVPPSTPPTITIDPTSQSIPLGQTASLTAAASGNPTPTVQWQISTNGGKFFSPIPGAISTTYSFSVTAAQNGNQFQAVFTNSQGHATTTPATVTVLPALTSPTITTNPTSQTVASGQNVTFSAVASSNPASTVQWQVSTDGGKTFASIPGANSTTYSFAATAAQNGNKYQAVFTNSQGHGTTTIAILTVLISPTVTTNPNSQSIPSGQAVTFAAAAGGNPIPTVQWQVRTNGGTSFVSIPGATSTTYSFVVAAAQNGNQYQAVFTNSQGHVTTTAAALTVLTTPTITTNPTSQIIPSGQTVILTAAAGGNPTPTVQWQVSTNGGTSFAAIPGATATTYSFAVTAVQNGNKYQAVFTNSQGHATTTPATLTVLISPTITTNPTSQSIPSGQTVTLTAAAGGNPTPTVQWQVSTNGGTSFAAIAGATSTTYSFAVTAAQNGNKYQAVFTNSQGHATTTPATLTVLTTPTITTNPTSQSIPSGQTVTLTAAASGNPTPTVQWQVSTNGGTSFTAIPGATSTTFSFAVTTAQNGNKYQAVFTNSQGHATTTPATLTVLTSPTVTTNPISQSIPSGQTVTLTAAAGGNPTPTVQWQVSTNGGTSFAAIPGATSMTYSFAVTAAQNGNKYQAVFTNSQGHVTTTPATLTILTSPTITTNPTSQSIASGLTVTFSAAAIGNPAPTVQWQVSTDNGKTYVNIAGATSTTYSFTVTAVQKGNKYQAVFTNSLGRATTTPALLTIS